ISAQGPSSASFLEFNPLFTRNGYTAQLSAMGGNNSTWGGDALVSGISGKFGYSVGYSHFQTDGFRTNADQWDNLAAVFLQYDFTPETSAQFEYRYRKTRQGDLQLNFFPDDVLPFLRANSETENYRIGLKHAFSPSSTLLFSVQYQHRETESHDVPPDALALDITEPDLKGASAEVQHLYR